MKVLLIMFFCIQDPLLELQNTCLMEYTNKQFNSVNECVNEVNKIKSEFEYLPDLYITGFCTSKSIQNT